MGGIADSLHSGFVKIQGIELCRPSGAFWGGWIVGLLICRSSGADEGKRELRILSSLVDTSVVLELVQDSLPLAKTG